MGDRRGRQHRPRLLDERVDPVAGQDIQLSIDLDVQQYAEQALETKLRNAATCRPTSWDQDIAAHNPIDPKKTDDERRVRQLEGVRRIRSGSSTRRRPARWSS